jgi:hypothetical protein
MASICIHVLAVVATRDLWNKRRAGKYLVSEGVTYEMVVAGLVTQNLPFSVRFDISLMVNLYSTRCFPVSHLHNLICWDGPPVPMAKRAKLHR